MSAPSKSSVSSKAINDSPGKSGLYLQPRTKIWILAICFTLMIAASVYAVLQPLKANPESTSFSARFWYPIETNPYARLQAVQCTDDYACRLNSVAVNGTGNLPEVWAVGNVGLVLHRAAGETTWKQLRITAKEENTAAPVPTPAPSPSYRPTPAATPTPQSALVPYLIGMSRDEAEKMAVGSGFQLEVAYDYGSAPNAMAQQGAPPDLRVIKQSPDLKTTAPLKSTIKVTLGRQPRSAAGLLDKLVPKVYAAGPEAEQQSPARGGLSRNQIAQLTGPISPASRSVLSPLDDDLLHVSCEKNNCFVLGRSARVYKINSGDQWSFSIATFQGITPSQTDSLSLLLIDDAGNAFAKARDAIYRCSLASSGARSSYSCNSNQGSIVQVVYGDSAHLHGVMESTIENSSPFLTSQFKSLGAPWDKLGAVIPNFRSIAFISTGHGFIVGDHGSIVSITEQDKTWRHETQGAEGATPNHRLPAPWYWIVAVVLIVTCSVTVAIPPPPLAAEYSVADWTVTDAPLKPGDVDSLGFTPMALGLSRFIRNPKTQAPVTIAIEGEWGEGKSSVMSLLRGDLEKSRYRPVWFNAWHHQSEEQLLAALLEHIKHQAVPPWWHIDNWIFRLRLLRYRFREKWPLVILLVMALCGVISFELRRHGLTSEDFVQFGKDSIRLIQYLLPWSTGQTQPPGELSRFGLVATLLAVFSAIVKKAKAFGIDPAKLTDNLRDASSVKDVKPDPGVRPRFALEFGDVCKAWSWGGRRVIIFIDDLDRCRPESVVTVLESINFLTTAGDCMIVLGIAQKQVTHCVGLGFKDIAHAEAAYQGGGNTEQEKAIARFKYGELYIRKLVNIFAPLPKTTPEQRRCVLEVRAAQARRQEEDQKTSETVVAWRKTLWTWIRRAGWLTAKAAPALTLAGTVALSVWIGYKQGIPEILPAGQTSNVSSATSAGAALPRPVPASGRAAGEAKPLVYDRPTTQAAVLAEPKNAVAGIWWSYGVDALFLVILFGILAYEFGTRTNQDAQNSPEFEDSLALWGQYIVGICDTPREIKRTLNDLRYQAMTRRSNGPSTTRGERLIRVLRQFVTGHREEQPPEIRVDEAALPPLKAAALAGLTDDERTSFLDPDKLDMKGPENLQRLIDLKREHVRRFGRWIGDRQQAPEPPDPITQQNVPPAARVAKQA